MQGLRHGPSPARARRGAIVVRSQSVVDNAAAVALSEPRRWKGGRGRDEAAGSRQLHLACET